MSRIIISVVPKNHESFSIDATDGKSSLQVECGENYIFWNLLKIKVRFTINNLIRHYSIS